MAESIAEMKAKLDSVLSCIEDIKELKQKQTSLEEKNKQLKASLEFAHTSIKELRDKMAVQDEAIDKLEKGVKSLTKQAATTTTTTTTFLFQFSLDKLHYNLFTVLREIGAGSSNNQRARQPKGPPLRFIFIFSVYIRRIID